MSHSGRSLSRHGFLRSSGGASAGGVIAIENHSNSLLETAEVFRARESLLA